MGRTSIKGNHRRPLFAKSSVRHSPEKMSETPGEIRAAWHLINQLVAFVQRYPVLLWSGVWVLLVAIIWFSATGLTHVDTFEVEQSQPEIGADASQTALLKPRLQAKPASSLGLLMAIAVSCGVTSLLLSKQFTPAKAQRGLVIKRQTAFPDQPLETVAHPPSPSAESKLSRQSAGDAVPRRSPPVETQPTVTVLPPEENHPLDWGDASLADLMDIRKQTSLSNYL